MRGIQATRKRLRLYAERHGEVSGVGAVADINPPKPVTCESPPGAIRCWLQAVVYEVVRFRKPTAYGIGHSPGRPTHRPARYGHMDGRGVPDAGIYPA